MRLLIILMPLIAIGLNYLIFKKDRDIKKFILSFLLLFFIVSFFIVGNIMRAVTPMFLMHIVAIVVAYGAMIYYIFSKKIIWMALISPIITLFIYLLLVWVGNEHLSSIF